MWLSQGSGFILILSLSLQVYGVTSQEANVYPLCDATRSVVNISANSLPVFIQSPNYTVGNYGNLQRCSVTLVSGSDPLVLSLNYSFFELEYLMYCGNDAVCVNGVNFCGNWLQGRTFNYILPAYRNFTIKFTTNSFVTYRGFEVSITARLADSQPVYQAAGIGSSQAIIDYTYNVYSPGMDYTDKCAPPQPSFPLPPQSQAPRAAQTTNDTNVYTLCDATRSVVNISANSTPVFIHSPNYTVGNYGNNLRCSIDIISGPDPLILSLNYSVFQLEIFYTCGFDALCVNGVQFCSDWLQGRTFNYILPAYRTFTITFTTDGSVTYRGFEIRLTSEFARGQVIQQVSSGVGFYESYINYTSVSYYPGYPYTNRCPATFTTTLQTTTARPTNVPPTLWRGLPVYTLCDYSRPNVVDIDGGNQNILIHSPNYFTGVPYQVNHHCSISLRSVDEPLILTLRYNSFQVEFTNPCRYDWLCAHGVLYCGDWLVGQTFQYIVPANNMFTLTFSADTVYVSRGFEIQVSSESIVNQTIREAIGGYGSSNNTIRYRNVTYHPGFSYTDRCASTKEAETAISNAIELLNRAKALLGGRN